jgi:hypothetical protein
MDASRAYLDAPEAIPVPNLASEETRFEIWSIR